MKMSKKVWAVLGFSLLVFTACGATNTDEKAVNKTAKVETADVGLNPFVSQEGNFSINFPGKPTVGVDNIGKDQGLSLNMTTYSYEPNDTDGFAVSYTDVSTDVIKKEDAQSYLKEEQTGLLETFGIKTPEEEKQVDYDGKYPGLRYKANISGMYIVAQTYVVGSRLYQIEMLKKGSYPTDEEVKNFTDSFKILK